MAVNTLKNDAQNLSIQNIDSEHTSAAITKNLTLKKADQIYYASMSSLLENIEDNALICIG